ncbi:MAG TPA: hypothetical protein VGI03_07070 [Verrucomicrobiae bacterium]|jgi:ABC-type lipoprotein export system ATPase subunit
MTEILKKLGLPETATEAEAVTTIDGLQQRVAVYDAAAEKESRIRAKMAESCGALNYNTAKEIVERN